MKKIKKDQRAEAFDIVNHVTQCDISYRGGTLKIDVSSIFPDVSDPVMGAYQNYLGGGIAGSIQGAAMFTPDELSEKDQVTFHALLERIKRYFYELNQGGGDEYMHENYTGPDAGGYDAVQRMPKSAY